MRVLQTLFLGLGIFSFDFASQAQWQLQQLCAVSNNAALGTPTFITQGTNGNFYGTLIHSPGPPPSSSATAGRFFEMTPSGAITFFPATTSPAIAGLNSELAPADDGGFYATTTTNVSFPFPSLGLILKLTASGQISTVFSFRNPLDGGRPSSIRRGLDGFFYGVTTGTNTVTFPPAYYKTIFRFATNNTLTTLYSVTNGTELTGAPVQGPEGFLYGTTSLEILGQPPFGSTTYRISFYRLSTNGDFTTLYTRSNSPAKATELIFGSDGSLYGGIGAAPATGFTGAKSGSIFRITTAGVFSNLFTFNFTNGFDLVNRLVLAADGSLYGASSGMIINGLKGAIFHISTNGVLTTLMTFQGSNEIGPSSPLVQANDGNLYGTGGMFGPVSGVAFRLVPPTAIALSISNGAAALTWNSFTNGIYRVEHKSNLSDPGWTALVPSMTAADSTVTVFDDAHTNTQRFYRVVLLP